jgi:hypothetical protein
MAKRKRQTEDDRRRLERMRENTERTRGLAEQGLAELPPSVREARQRAGSNAAWLRELAEKAQAELDRREQQQV